MSGRFHRVTLQDYGGDVLQASDLSAIAKLFGLETVALHRSVLQRVLSEQLPWEIITFGTEVRSLSQSADAVSVVLTDGSIITAKLVVGADGIRSGIRTLASLGGEMRYSGSSSSRAIARGADLLSSGEDHVSVGCAT